MNKMLKKLKKLRVIVDSLTPDENAELYNKSKEKDFISDTLKKYGFNPVVTTIGSLNQVSLKDSARLNSKELDYLKNLGKTKDSAPTQEKSTKK